MRNKINSCHSEASAEESTFNAASRPDSSVSSFSQNDVRLPQSGRSLTEMLATLAITGILSILALTGFNYAMNNLRANNIIYEISKRAQTCSFQRAVMGKNMCSLGEFPNHIEGYNSSIITVNERYFGIKVNDIPQEICRQIHSKGLKGISQIHPNPCEDLNEMIFVFDNELGGITDNIPSFCQENSDCNICQNCNTDGVCQNQKGRLIAYTDQTHETVQSCSSCPGEGNGYVDYTTQSECQKCGSGFLYAANRFCFHCHSTNRYLPEMKVSRSECDRCDNRCWTKGGECVVINSLTNPDQDGDGLCDQVCPKGRTLLYKNKTLTEINSCGSCGTESYYTTKEECQRCGYGYAFVDNQYCMYCMTHNGNLTQPKATLDECRRCDNRCLDNNNHCIEFDAIHIDRDSDGYCVNLE